MTLNSKCETCRSRKVKCDEKKPKCSACVKGNRKCSYTGGNPAAFVVEDPTKYSKHGKAQVAPRVYPILAPGEPSSGRLQVNPTNYRFVAIKPSEKDEPAFQITSEKSTGSGGVYRTLALVGRGRHNKPRKYTHQQRRRLQLHLQCLKRTATYIPYQTISPEAMLANRYLSVLDGRPFEHQPLAILGTWIMSIPSRIGHCPHVDFAVEFLADSIQFFREQNFSNQKLALCSKAKALKALQLEVDQCRTRQTYETAIAIKLNFAAEVFMGLNSFSHAIHTVALGQILRQGCVTDPDEEHYWSLVDNTYGEDVSEAILANRPSIYDNEFYINATKPSSIPRDAPLIRRISMSIMHLAVRLPRLVCLVRHISEHPDDAKKVNTAISLTETIWSVDPIETAHELLDTSATKRPIPPSKTIADIVPDSIYFDSVASAVQASRLWATIVALCGITETLHRCFPEYYANSSLPDLAYVWERDEESATSLARLIPYSLAVSPALPILPLRIHTTFQISVGTWHRLSLRLQAEQAVSEEEDHLITERIEKAKRMVDWILEQCNETHDIWKVDHIPKDILVAAVEDMAAAPVHYWLPRAVNFETEDGEMVMNTQYGITLPDMDDDGNDHVSDRTTTTRSLLEKNDEPHYQLPPSFLNKPVRVMEKNSAHAKKIDAEKNT